MYEVTVANSGDSRFLVRSKDCEFTIDTKGQGVTPPDTLLASLGSCIGVYLRKYNEHTSLNLKEFAITVRGELSREAPVSFRAIEVTVDLKGALLDEARKQSLLRFIRNCPVHNTLEAGPSIEIQLIGHP